MTWESICCITDVVLSPGWTLKSLGSLLKIQMPRLHPTKVIQILWRCGSNYSILKAPQTGPLGWPKSLFEFFHKMVQKPKWTFQPTQLYEAGIENHCIEVIKWNHMDGAKRVRRMVSHGARKGGSQLVLLGALLWVKGFSTHLLVQFSSVSQPCPTLCDPMNCSTPGLTVHHQLPELTQTHVHRVGDVIQPSHPLSSPFSPAPNPSQHQSLFQWVSSSHELPKILEFQL